jgi:hypothetical protein
VFYYSNYKSIRYYPKIILYGGALLYKKKMDTNTAYFLIIIHKNDDHRESFFHLSHLTSELVA